MIVVDANLLIYAVNEDAPLHRKAKTWLETALSGSETNLFFVERASRVPQTDDAAGVVSLTDVGGCRIRGDGRLA
jgi:predicted nucleic acid-binding protein